MHNEIIETTSIRDQVANIIREMILSGKLKGNQQIKEREISEKLNISTTPIKEAFRLLESEGIIYTKPRRGTFISNFSKDIMLQIVFMRSALDGTAAYFACENASDEDIKILKQILDDVKILIDRGTSSKEISIKNAQFHNKIRSCANNNYLSNLINNMNNIDNLFRDLALAKEEVELSRSHKDHMAIYNSIKSRDSEEAERIMKTHIRRVAVFVAENNLY